MKSIRCSAAIHLDEIDSDVKRRDALAVTTMKKENSGSLTQRRLFAPFKASVIGSPPRPAETPIS